jgi:hypothetical protein
MSAQASYVDLVFLTRDLLDLLEPGQIEKESQSLFEEPRQEQRIVQRVHRIALQRTLKRGPIAMERPAAAITSSRRRGHAQKRSGREYYG